MGVFLIIIFNSLYINILLTSRFNYPAKIFFKKLIPLIYIFKGYNRFFF